DDKKPKVPALYECSETAIKDAQIQLTLKRQNWNGLPKYFSYTIYAFIIFHLLLLFSYMEPLYLDNIIPKDHGYYGLIPWAPLAAAVCVLLFGTIVEMIASGFIP